MKYDIKQCSAQTLNRIFSPLDKLKNFVFWIRNHDMSQQIYVSAQYTTHWQRQVSILYDIPLMWLDYLARDNKDLFMGKFQARHVEHYLNPAKNLLLYQIDKPNQTLGYLRDQSFRCADQTGAHYIVGVSKVIEREYWHEQFQTNMITLDDKDEESVKLFFKLLKENFGLVEVNALNIKPVSLGSLRQCIANKEKIDFSKREIECLYHLCQGKTAKQTAREMSISPRTVETFIEHIRNKSTTHNKVEVVGRFSHYFSDVPDLPTLLEEQ